MEIALPQSYLDRIEFLGPEGFLPSPGLDIP